MWVVSRSAVLVSFFLAAVLPGMAMGEVPGENLLEIQPGKTGTDIRLDRAAIETLPQIDFQTTTIWTDGTHHFSGPSLLSVLRVAGIVDGVVSLRAANDYSVEIPVAELTENAPIIASRIDGKPFDLREKGPLWLVYPYDSSPDYQSETVYSRSLWQLVAISRGKG